MHWADLETRIKRRCWFDRKEKQGALKMSVSLSFNYMPCRFPLIWCWYDPVNCIDTENIALTPRFVYQKPFP